MLLYDFNPRSPCGERRGDGTNSGATGGISIHAPLAGSDVSLAKIRPFPTDFNPRSPCGERPGRGKAGANRPDFNPRSPCGERRHGYTFGARGIQFQSTLPLRGATYRRLCSAIRPAISIHAPLAGSDYVAPFLGSVYRYFNPRSPCGERRPRHDYTAAIVQFQSTLPLRGATPVDGLPPGFHRDFNPRSPCGERRNGATYTILPEISIHAPLAGSDPEIRMFCTSNSDFNPRSPCGERRSRRCEVKGGSYISIHAPLAGSDRIPEEPVPSPFQFQSTLPLRGATIGAMTDS